MPPLKKKIASILVSSNKDAVDTAWIFVPDKVETYELVAIKGVPVLPPHPLATKLLQGSRI